MFRVQEETVQPSLVILYFGGNDATNPHPSGLGAHVPLPEYIENMRKIIAHIKVSATLFCVAIVQNLQLMHVYRGRPYLTELD